MSSELPPLSGGQPHQKEKQFFLRWSLEWIIASHFAGRIHSTG
jgi:hypothetical protein